MDEFALAKLHKLIDTLEGLRVWAPDADNRTDTLAIRFSEIDELLALATGILESIT